MRFVGAAQFPVLNINYCNSLSSANHMQVLISDFRLVQRRAIEEVIQPGSHKNNFANLAVVTIQTCAISRTLRYDVPLTKKASM